MTTLTYADAMGEALDRLRGVGYEHGSTLVNHAPMAAEALATLGYADVVPTWVDANLRHRHYHQRPAPRWTLSAHDEAGWRQALGDFSRVADWTAMFDRELAEQPWQDVLRMWWPALLPGMSGVLTHGVIRTAHAVRSLAQAPDGGPQRAELAQGLGYWAARYAHGAMAGSPEPGPTTTEDDGHGAVAAIDDLIAEGVDHYLRTTRGHPVPLIHAVTGPAAVRFVCQYLPEEQWWPSYRVARRTSERMRGHPGPPAGPGGSGTFSEASTSEPPAATALVAEAVELGDEHAIKMVEVAIRHNAISPDARFLAAAHAAITRLRDFLGANSYYA